VAPGLEPVALGLEPVALGLEPVALGLEPVALGLGPVALGLGPMALGHVLPAGRDGGGEAHYAQCEVQLALTQVQLTHAWANTMCNLHCVVLNDLPQKNV
jgi:hypothetical protein